MACGRRSYPEWAKLQAELLGSIAERLSTLDYLRFGAVCKSWASVASVEKGLYLPLSSNRQIPLFLIPEQFFCISEKQWHPIPEMEGKWCIGSQFGWLALIDATSKSDPSLLNPLTRAHIHLPSKTLVPGRHDVTFRAFRKIVFSSPPGAASRYTAVAITGRLKYLVFHKEGQDCWTILKEFFVADDIIYRDGDGKFVAIAFFGGVKVVTIDLTGPSPPVITDLTFNLETHLTATFKLETYKGPSMDSYLVESYGDLLHVSIQYVGGFTVKVTKFDAELTEWIPLESLGHRSIFLGWSHSISVEDSTLRPNCVYFAEHVANWLQSVTTPRSKSQVLWAVDLEDGRVESYYPSIPRMKCPPPVWFTPSLL